MANSGMLSRGIRPGPEAEEELKAALQRRGDG